jgi:hypothetical protein
MTPTGLQPNVADALRNSPLSKRRQSAMLAAPPGIGRLSGEVEA